MFRRCYRRAVFGMPWVTMFFGSGLTLSIRVRLVSADMLALRCRRNILCRCLPLLLKWKGWEELVCHATTVQAVAACRHALANVVRGSGRRVCQLRREDEGGGLHCCYSQCLPRRRGSWTLRRLTAGIAFAVPIVYVAGYAQRAVAA
jgi:hypothetical protein